MLSASPLRTLAFGDLDAGLWGAAWGGMQPFVAVGSLTGSMSCAGSLASIDGSSATDDWTVSGEHVELTVSPHGDPAGSPALEGFDQLCRVRGQFVLDGTEHAVDSLGRRGCRPELDLEKFEAIRDISAWFEPDEGIALTALRPRGAAGHDHDLVVASVLEPAGATPVADPRLSTTYAADGRPARVGVELWVDVDDDEEEQQYPRRAAGEALGASASAPGELDLQAHAFRWHSRGRDGAGVYVLARTK